MPGRTVGDDRPPGQGPCRERGAHPPGALPLETLSGHSLSRATPRGVRGRGWPPARPGPHPPGIAACPGLWQRLRRRHRLPDCASMPPRQWMQDKTPDVLSDGDPSPLQDPPPLFYSILFVKRCTGSRHDPLTDLRQSQATATHPATVRTPAVTQTASTWLKTANRSRPMVSPQRDPPSETSGCFLIDPDLDRRSLFD